MTTENENFLKRLGQVIQGCTLGTLLLVAMYHLIVFTNEAVIFRYQGF